MGKGKSKDEIEMFDQFGIGILPLEMHLKSKKGKADVTILLVDIDETFSETIFSTEGHTLNRVD